MTRANTAADIWAHVKFDGVAWEESPCWEWLGYRSVNGYGRVAWQGRFTAAHRITYELFFAPYKIPRGLTLDHLCRVRHCVNPEHLEPVTSKVNILRGVGVTAQKARQTQCIHGHPFDIANTGRSPRMSRVSTDEASETAG
jgi:hypothetical protein